MTDGIAKARTGIDGFDELTLGGLPRGRPTLVCGSAGCGKTLFASTFLINGARNEGEPGVFVTFEERPGDIVDNVRSLGFGLGELIEQKKIHIEHIAIDPSELAEVGDYDLEGLFLRLELAVAEIGAKRIVLDTIESLFSAFHNPAILRAEIRRLFDWLKERELTAVITGERGDGTLTRQGLEEYVSDCVILLDHRTHNQVSTRRLRIVKFRGTAHGTNEYPFLNRRGRLLGPAGERAGPWAQGIRRARLQRYRRSRRHAWWWRLSPRQFHPAERCSGIGEKLDCSLLRGRRCGAR